MCIFCRRIFKGSRWEPGAIVSTKYITIQSVARAVAIMEFIAHQDGEGITAISEAVGLHKSTCFGLLHTLQELGMVQRNAKTGGFSLGLKTFMLGQAYTDNLDIRRLARPYLRSLADEALETVHLVIREGMHAVYIDKIESPHAMAIISQVGRRAKLHCTGVGKVILAHMAAWEQEEILARPLEKFTEYTLTEPDALRAELADIRKNGVGFDRQEIEIGLCCLAAPVFDAPGNCMAAVSISGPTTRLTKSRVNELKPSLLQAVGEISRLQGFTER